MIELDVHRRRSALWTVAFALLLPCQKADVVGFLRYRQERLTQGASRTEDFVSRRIEAGDGAAHDAHC